MNSFYNPTDFLMKHFFSCNFMLVAILIVFTLSTMNILILKYDIAKSQRVAIKRLQGGCGEGGNIESLEQKTLISNEDMEKAILF